ncbi:MAG: type II toxin-antitoxin system prevent-host-death family antitoxin [Pseudohongiellaceae bacterium]
MKVPVRTLKNSLSEYLRRASAGEEILITSHNKVVAKLVAPELADKISDQDPQEYSTEKLMQRLRSLPRAQWKGGKPKRRPGISPKRGDRTLAEQILEDRR